MTEERFALIDGIKPGTHSGIWDNLKQNNQRIGDELWLGEVVAMLNEGVILAEEKEQLKERNQRQAKRLAELYELMAKKDWESLTEIIDDFKQCEEQLQREWRTYE